MSLISVPLVRIRSNKWSLNLCTSPNWIISVHFGYNSRGSSELTTSGIHPWLLGCHGEVILWQGVKESRLHLPAGGVAGEEKKENIEKGKRDEMNPLPSWLLANGVSFLSFFPSFIVCHIGPGPGSRAVLPKLLVVDLTPFHWQETSDLFCIWSMKKHESGMPMIQTYHLIHPHALSSLSFVVCYQGGKRSPPPTQRHRSASGAWWLSFSISLSHTVCKLPFLFSVTCSFWFKENYQAYTIEAFFLSLSLLPAHPPTRASLYIALFSIKIVPLNKRDTDAFTHKAEMGLFLHFEIKGSLQRCPPVVCRNVKQSEIRSKLGLWSSRNRFQLLVFPAETLCDYCLLPDSELCTV